MKLNRLSLAFGVPAYRWLWANSFASSAGHMPFTLGQGWLLLLETDSPFMVGLGPGLGGVVNMMCSPFAGVLVDRLNRRTILMMTQVTLGLAVLTLGVLVVTNVVEVWHILVTSMVQGMMMGFLNPARNTLMYDVVGRRAGMHAMAGQQLSNNSSSILWPLGAGFIIAGFGIGLLFLIIGSVLFLGILFLLPLSGMPRVAPHTGSMWHDFKDGIGFAMHDRPIRTVLWTVLITEALGFSSWTMYPVITRNVLHAGPIVLGLLATFRGSGGIVGALFISGLGEIKPKGFVLATSAFAFGCFLIIFASSSNLALSLGIIFLVGTSGAIYDVMIYTLIQTLSPAAMRGRMMGLQAFLASGVFLGSMGMGAVASWLSVKWAIGSGGAVVAVNALNLAPKARMIGEQAAARIEV